MAGPCEMERFLLLKGNRDNSGGHRQWVWESRDTLMQREEGPEEGGEAVLDVRVQASAEPHIRI